VNQKDFAGFGAFKQQEIVQNLHLEPVTVIRT
jgi:hypothetical protein